MLFKRMQVSRELSISFIVLIYKLPIQIGNKIKDSVFSFEFQIFPLKKYFLIIDGKMKKRFKN